MNNFVPFIDRQFPVTILSAECYKERKAGSGQTLTGLGKWWGRKPLILVRATLLGHLMPASDDEQRDMEIFLKILTMDDEGLRSRQKKKIDGRKWATMTLSEKLKDCRRPEEIDGPSPEAWREINAHLGTEASNLVGLFQQLSLMRFGTLAKVGDCFCGGGSIPFEAARMGLEAYASDLNPIACLLTWGALNIVGGGPEKAKEVQEEQDRVYKAVEKQIEEWGIERSGEGWRAEYYLYCVEVQTEDGWKIPLSPSWVIGKKTKTIAILKPDPKNRCFEIEIKSSATDDDMKRAENGTIEKGWITNPHTGSRVQLATLRGDNRRVTGKDERGKIVYENFNTLRPWENEDVTPRPDDLFQERLYCVRWETPKGSVYRAPDGHDLKNEEKCLRILKENFEEWQEEGHIPSMRIEPGYNTAQPIRERGWTHWHHLFNPRQLLVNGLFNALGSENIAFWNNQIQNWSSKLTVMNRDAGRGQQTFSNQSLNTLNDYCTRALKMLRDLRTDTSSSTTGSALTSTIKCGSAATSPACAHFWVTDPPYADAVNYDELSEFFLAWVEKKLPKLFPEWSTSSNRHQAVRGKGESFADTISQIYANLRKHTLPGGAQTIMFNHSSNEVWGEMTDILIRAGLEVTSLWSIRTETENASKGKGNYVQATYLIQVKARDDSRPPGMKASVLLEVLRETERQVASMQSLNKGEQLLFNMSDFALAGKTAQMKVLTRYNKFVGVPHAEIKNFAQEMGRKAEEHVSRMLIPEGFCAETWSELTGPERFYLSTVSAESEGNTSLQSIQDAGRLYMEGRNTKDLVEVESANAARLVTPEEARGRDSILGLFGGNLLAPTFSAVWQTIRKDPEEGNRILKEVFPEDLADKVGAIKEILEWMGSLKMEHWTISAEAAKALRNIAGRI
jgi:putative DNA methylase